MADAPRFSVITPVYDTPADVFWAMVGSVRRQSFGDWELCLVDDCSPDPQVEALLEAAEALDPRIRVARRAENGGIVAASNDAVAMARGEFLALLDHDDELHPDALLHVERALREEPEADYAYTDEDKIDRAGRHSGPFFKPDWSPERMRTQMYSCHLSVFRRSLVEEVGGFDPEFEGSQDWDLVLKATERARAVVHVPRVLYHWRMLEGSTAGSDEAAKPWAFEAGTRAVQAHLDRIGMPARCIHDRDDRGVYHLDPELSAEPLVSIVIPTAGQVREVRYEPVVLISHCLRSIVETSTYENYELVVVVDSPAEPALLEELREIGAVGGRLLLQDGRLQHVGVRFENGLPGHFYWGFRGDFRGYANAVRVATNCLAVTAACLMTRRELFERLDGLSEDFPVNYNDVDYCLRLRGLGKRTVYDPDLEMIHFESSSRSSAVNEWEKQLFREMWLPFTAVDPYSNPQLRHELPRPSSKFSWMRRRPQLRRHRLKGQPA